MRYTNKLRVRIHKLLATTNCNVTKLCTLTGIDRSTYYKWYNDYEDFRNVIKYSRAEFRSIKRESVISALYRRAMGYTVTEVKETVDKILEDSQTKGKTVYHKKHIPPCHKSIMYILKHFDTDGFEIPDYPQGTQSVVETEIFVNDEISVESKIETPVDTLQCTPLPVLLCTQSGRCEGVAEIVENEIESEVIENEFEVIEEEIQVDIIPRSLRDIRLTSVHWKVVHWKVVH